MDSPVTAPPRSIDHFQYSPPCQSCLGIEPETRAGMCICMLNVPIASLLGQVYRVTSEKDRRRATRIPTYGRFPLSPLDEGGRWLGKPLLRDKSQPQRRIRALVDSDYPGRNHRRQRTSGVEFR